MNNMDRASLIVLSCFLILILINVADGMKRCPPWCVSKVDQVPDSRTQLSLDWVCGNGADCGPIQPGGPCWANGNLKALASYAFNDYFQKIRHDGGRCNFGDTAELTNTDPSYGACQFTCSLI